MVNPFAEIDWNPDRPAVKAFGRIVVIVSVIVAPVAFGLHQWLDKPFFLFLARMFSVFLGLGAISYLLPAIGKYIYKVWYFLSACIGLVVTNVLLMLFFYGFFTPIALFMRYVIRRDPLTLKQPSSTTWTDHLMPASISRYYRQY
ncbi:MAG: hypothetical protein R3F19_30190 [Verrucomicrobiales bacterium]